MDVPVDDGSSDGEIVNAVQCTSVLGVIIVWDKPNQPHPEYRVWQIGSIFKKCRTLHFNKAVRIK